MANKRKIAGAALLALFAACASAQTATTDPVGFVRKDLARGFSGYAAPMIDGALFSGKVASNTATTVTFEGSGLRLGSVLGSMGDVYLEISGGSLEGERVDLDETASIAADNGTITLDLTAIHNTNTPAAGALVGSPCVLRRHMTLGRMQVLFSPALVGNNTPDLADRIHVFSGGSWIRYTLRSDNVTWRRAGDANNQAALVIPPGVGVLVELISGAKSALQVGTVRMNAFRVNLVAGTQCLAPAYPLSISPLQMGAFVEANDPAGIRWTGNNNAGLADNLFLFQGGSFIRYNLRTDGVSWRRAGSTWNFANDPIVEYDGPTLVKRINPDAAYLMLRPF